MATTITQKTSWFKKIKNSLQAVFLGIVLFAISFPILFWNEGRAIKRQKSLEEGAGTVVEAQSTPINQENNNKLIHTTGKATTEENLTDTNFQVTANKALKLKRTVKMYQWIEDEDTTTEDKIGGGTETTTTYTYHKGWSEDLEDSSSFAESGHDNPSTMPYESKDFTAKKITVGDFELSNSLKNSINKYTELKIKQEQLPEITNIKINNGNYYIGNDPQNPQIGDLEISYEVIYPTEVSIIAKQDGNKLTSYKTKVGGELEMLKIGKVSAEEMFANALKVNNFMTWGIRFGGFLLMYLGLVIIFKPLSVLGDVIPFIGDMIGFSSGLVAGIIAFGLSLVTISIAWIFARPVIAVILLILAVIGTTLGIQFLLKKKKNS